MSEQQDYTLKLQARICQLEQQTAQLQAERDGAIAKATCVQRQHTAAQRRRDVLQGERDAAAGECDQLRAQVERLRQFIDGSAKRVLRGAASTLAQQEAERVRAVLADTPAQSVAHIEAAALRRVADRFERVCVSCLMRCTTYACAPTT